MSKSLNSTIALVVSFCLFSPANAALINIIDDNTTAHAQVTYDPGAVSDPGTTLDTFSGPLFPSAVFSGFNLVGNRMATIPLGSGYFDTTHFYAGNEALIRDGYYKFYATLGTDAIGQAGATGNASAETDLNLRFQVTGGDSMMDLFAANEGNSITSLALFDETLGVFVETLAPTTWSYDGAADVTLFDNHIYTLNGYLYAYDHFNGDPSGNFGFRFKDDLVLADVPEPEAITLLLLGLIGLAWVSRSRLGYPTA